MKRAPRGPQLGSRNADRIDAFLWLQVLKQGFHGGSVVKNPPANAGDAGSIPDEEDTLEKEMATHSSIVAWEIPWTAEPGGFSQWGHSRVRQS